MRIYDYSESDERRLPGARVVLSLVIALRRDPDPADRRAKIITLTDLGLERYKPTRRDIRAMERRRLRGVGAAEIASLRHLLALLASD